MNRLIAKIFASIIGFIHFFALGALCLTSVAFFGENGKTLRESMHQNNVPPEIVGFVLFVLAVAYVLVVGFVSTVISANENLERLNEKLDKVAKP
jgi:hypothetical protein